MSSLFDLWHAWLPFGELTHNDAASFQHLLSHRAEADRCFQAQLMPVSSPEPTGCGVRGPGTPLGALSLEPVSQRLLFPSQEVGNVPSDFQYHQHTACP